MTTFSKPDLQWDKKWLIIAICGALAVTLGAFGAHALKDKLTEVRLSSYQTGVLYHFIHTLAMAFAIIAYEISGEKRFHRSFKLFLFGILFFSGSLYLLSTQDLLGMSMSWLGPITPIGGLFFIGGWLSLVKFKKEK